MIIVYRYLVTFEDVEDVERVIEIKASQTFYELQLAILDSIGFDKDKDASFYMSGDFWRKGRELALRRREGALNMKKAVLNQFMMDPHQKILFNYDFENLWELRVQLTKISKAEDENVYPRCVRRTGESPRQYPITQITEGSEEFNEMVEDVLNVETPEIDIDTDSLLADFNDILAQEKKKGDDSKEAGKDKEA